VLDFYNELGVENRKGKEVLKDLTKTMAKWEDNGRP